MGKPKRALGRGLKNKAMGKPKRVLGRPWKGHQRCPFIEFEADEESGSGSGGSDDECW